MLVECVGVLIGGDLRPSSPRVGSLVIVVAVVFGILLHYPGCTFFAAADTVAGRLLPCDRDIHTVVVVVLLSMHLCNYNV